MDKRLEIEISVCDPQKIGAGWSAYIVYKVLTRLNVSRWEKKNFNVSRRFSDFLGLHEKLIKRHLYQGIIIPPAPAKSFKGTAKIKMFQRENLPSDTFIAKRRAALERYLKMIASHPVLRMGPDFRHFLETESELPKATSTSALSEAGVDRMINQVFDTFQKEDKIVSEPDPWFERKHHGIQKLEKQLRELKSSIESIICDRKRLSQSIESFARSARVLGIYKEQGALLRSFQQLAEVEYKVGQLVCLEVNPDLCALSMLLNYYINQMDITKDGFCARVKTYELWKSTEFSANQVRKELSRGDNLPERRLFLRKELEKMREKTKERKKEFIRIFGTIHKEVERIEKEMAEEFKRTIEKYVEQLSGQESVNYWKSLLSKLKAN